MKRKINLYLLSFILLSLLFSCKEKIKKNYFEEAKKIAETNQDDYKKYAEIFKSEISKNLKPKEKIELGKNFINLSMGWNKIFTDRNGKLYQHSVLNIYNNTEIVFNRCFIDVYTTLEIGNKSYQCETGYKVNFDTKNWIKLIIKHPIDNSFFLNKNRKYHHLDKTYLKKEIKNYNMFIKIRAINDDEGLFIPLYDNNLSYMWNDYRYYDIER